MLDVVGAVSVVTRVSRRSTVFRFFRHALLTYFAM